MTKHGSPEVLQVQDRPKPEAGPGETLVRVTAAGINFADLMARVGLYPDAPKPPSVVGYEFAGETEDGRRVIGGTRFGGYAEYVVSRSDQLIDLPEGWSFEEGAGLPVNYATAYAGLVRYGNLQAGERVLIQAAAGGVGIAATQIAKAMGAEVWGTASAGKHDAITAFGVDHPIDYRSVDFAEAIDEPLDLVMDAVGGKSFKKSYGLLRPGGRLICFGASSVMKGERRDIPTALKMLAQTPRFNPIKMASESKAVIGLNMLKIWDERESINDFVDPLTEWIADGTIKPVVAKAFPLEQGPDAHRYLGEAKNVGKVVLTL